MNVAIEHDLTRFLARVEPFLTARRAENTMIITVIQLWLTGESPAMARTGAYASDGAGRVVGVAVNQQGWRVVLSAMPADAAVLLERALAGVDPGVPLVSGPPGPAERFAQHRAARLGSSYRRGTRFGMFTVADVRAPALPGSARPARADDVPLLTRWLTVFETPRQAWQASARLSNLLAHGQVFVWEAGGAPVAVCACTGALWEVSSIGPAYTVPEHRGAGYGLALWGVTHAAARERGAEVVATWANLDYRPTTRILTKSGAELTGEACDYAVTADRTPPAGGS